MDVGNVELTARCMRKHLVMLLEDLVKTHVVQVDKLLKLQEVVTNTISLLDESVNLRCRSGGRIHSCNLGLELR